MIDRVPLHFFTGLGRVVHDDPRSLQSILNELIDAANMGSAGDMKMAQAVECLATDAVGDWVAIRGDRVGVQWRVQRADCTDITKMPAVGVLISKDTPTTGLIQVLGPCTIFTGLDYTAPVAWLGPTGVQFTMPTGPAIVQRLGVAVADDVLWISGSMELMELI